MVKRGKEPRGSEGLSPLGDVMRAMERLNPGLSMEVLELWRTWKEIVGEELAGVARPSEWKKGVLFVKVVDPIWLQELTYKKQELLEGLKRKLSKPLLKDIRFTLGRY